MKKDNMKLYVKKLVEPIFKAQFPKETFPNSMTTNPPLYKIFWRPNNYRRKIAVKTKCYSTIKNIQSAIDSTIKRQNFNLNTHNKLISIKNYKGITIQYGKDKLTGIYSQKIIRGNKEVFLITANSQDDIEERIGQKKANIKRKIDNGLKAFIKEFNLKKGLFKPKWDRYEDMLKGEDYIDNIPKDLIIHDTYFKKVYGEGIEFIQSKNKEKPTVHLKNYIKNQALKRLSPEIVDALNSIARLITNKFNIKLINSVDDVFKYQEEIIVQDQLTKDRITDRLFCLNGA